MHLHGKKKTRRKPNSAAIFFINLSPNYTISNHFPKKFYYFCIYHLIFLIVTYLPDKTDIQKNSFIIGVKIFVSVNKLNSHNKSLKHKPGKNKCSVVFIVEWSCYQFRIPVHIQTITYGFFCITTV